MQRMFSAYQEFNLFLIFGSLVTSLRLPFGKRATLHGAEDAFFEVGMGLRQRKNQRDNSYRGLCFSTKKSRKLLTLYIYIIVVVLI